MAQLEPYLESDDQKYTNYVDPSTIMIDHYRNQPPPESTERCIQKIEQWLATSCSKQDNKPLVFSTYPGSGQIPVLVKWIEANQEHKSSKKQKSFVVIHFASMGGNSTNYFYAIYRFLIKLRESLKIKQKVQLLEQKIRKYFAYWLDVCGSQLQKQLIVNDTVNIYDKIIIVIEGIQNFKDPQTGKESNIAFWLPRCFPPNIKVIVTADANSDAINHFIKNGSEIVQLQSGYQPYSNFSSKYILEDSVLKPHLQKELIDVFEKTVRKSNIKDNISLFHQAFVSTLFISNEKNDSDTLQFLKDSIQQKFDIKSLNSIQTLQNLYEVILNFWSHQFQFKFRDLLLGLMITQKGLTYKELKSLCSLQDRPWKHFKSIFRFCLIQYKEMYMIQGQIFKSTIMKMFSVKQQYLRQIHEKIADVLEQTPNSIRKLEEQTYHLYVSKCYFKLKQKISNIENFLLLFNPSNKYDFSRYWQKLQEKGFDPVIEYNKAIEGFSMHYHPTEQSIFRIIVQISRFLKEFCDFQTYFTPNFRHPPIQGSMTQMDKIGLLKQLEKLEIYIDNSCNSEEKTINHPSLSEQIKQLRNKYFPVEPNEKKYEPQKVLEVENTTKNYSKDQQKKPSILLAPILSQIQQLNVDVPKNREKFRNFYMNLLKDYMQKKQSKQNAEMGQLYLEDQNDSEVMELKNVKKEKVPQLKLIKLKENFSTIQIKPSLYYYKRWIWIQFPWACISLHNNYSKTPELCLTSATQYMSVEAEAEFTRQALKIAIQAKERKKLMFTQKIDNNNQSKKLFSSTKTQFRAQSVDLKMKTVSGTSVFSALKNINLNLQSLTKQLELKRTKYPERSDQIRKPQAYESSTFALTETKQKQGDFIQKRKVFTITNPNTVAKSELLPKIKSQIKDHTLYELNYLKSHIQQKKKSINQIIYQNNKLEKIYKQLKIKEWQSNELTTNQNKKSKNFQELERKKQVTITEFCKSLLQKERLKIILKLCSENKTKNEEYLTSLNYLLQNLKKMINWEKSDMKKLQTELQQIQALNELTKEASKQKQHNEQILNSQIRMAIEAKNKIQSQITQMSMVINQEVYLTKSKFQDNLCGDRLKNQQKNRQLQLQRNAKMIEDQLQTMQKNYNQVAKILNLTDFNFRQSGRYKQLMHEKQRNKQLNLILFQKTNRLQQLKLSIQQQKEAMNRQSQTHTVSLPSQVKNQNKQLRQLNETCLKYKIGFQNLGLRLKLKEKKSGNILEEIACRLNKFREEDEQGYNRMIATNTNIEPSYIFTNDI